MNSCENAIIAINYALFHCSNIRWITQKGFEHAVFSLVFKNFPRDPSTVWTLKTMVDPYIEKLAPEQCTLMKNSLLLGLPKASVVSEDLLKMSVSEMKLSLSSTCGIVTTIITQPPV